MDKKTAKQYLLSLAALFFIGTACLFFLLLGLRANAYIAVPCSAGQLLLGAAALACIPGGSYAGFCTVFLSVTEWTPRKMTLFVVFFPIFLAFTIIFGIIMIIPSVIKSIQILRG